MWTVAIGLAVVTSIIMLVAWMTHPKARTVGVPTLGEHLHSIVAIDSNGTLIVGTHGASAISTDGGKSLRPIPQLAGVDAMESSVGSGGKTVIVAGHDGAVQSVDGGRAWRSFGIRPGNDIHGLALDAQHPSNIVVFVVGIGVFETHNDGAAWRRLADPPASPTGTGYVTGRTIVLPSMPSGLLRSDDDGATWRLVAHEVGGLTLARNPNAPHELLLSGVGPLFISHDGGRKWSQQNLPPGAEVVTSGKGGMLYAAGFTQDKHATLWTSRDDARTWTMVNSG